MLVTGHRNNYSIILSSSGSATAKPGLRPFRYQIIQAKQLETNAKHRKVAETNKPNH